MITGVEVHWENVAIYGAVFTLLFFLVVFLLHVVPAWWMDGKSWRSKMTDSPGERPGHPSRTATGS